MRRRQHVGQCAQRMRVAERLGVVDIHRCPGDLSARECLEQRGFVDDRTSRGIDQPVGRLHLREFGRADQMLGARTQTQVNGQKVRENSSSLLTRCTPFSCARSSVRF